MAGNGIATDVTRSKADSKPGSPSTAGGGELDELAPLRKESSPECSSYGGGGRVRRGAVPGGPEGGIQKSKKRFVGVRQRPSGRWVAEIKDTTQKIRLWLGTFDTAEDAARAYDEAAQILRGANTRTNFVPSPVADASALPSKAARLLLLRKNKAAAAAAAQAQASNNSSEDINKLSRSLAQQQQRQRVMTTSPTDYEAQASVHSLPMKSNASSSSSSPQRQQQQQQHPAASAPSVNMTSSNYSSMNLSSSTTCVFDCRRDMNKCSESSAFDSPTAAAGDGGGSCHGMVEDVDMNQLDSTGRLFSSNNSGAAAESSPAAAHGQFGGAGNFSNREILISNRSDYAYNTSSSCDNGAIREIRKEQDYSCVAPGRMDSLDTDISCSALSGLDDVDLSCVDSFDFSAEMNNITSSDLNSLMPEVPVVSCSSFQTDFVDSTAADPLLSEHMRRRMYERNLSASLYAMNGVQECLMLYTNTSSSGTMTGSAIPYCMSSPSLSLPPSFKRSLSGSGFKGSQNTTGWTQNVKLGGSFSEHHQSDGPLPKSDSSESKAVTGDCPNQEALWNSWDLSPLCVVA